jgi:glycogen operon protein
VNYWGYSTLGFFAPDARYSSAGETGEQVREFKAMVKVLHAAGIEVLLDVVYNHTAEGNHEGPTLSLRGIDNRTYYRLNEDAPRYYMDFTGCGNTLDTRQPPTLQLVMDSLRYWVEEMHVDGFRFDLASALARGRLEYDRFSAFFLAVHQDPVLQRVKLIAEPWDAHGGGYQIGNYPARWAEWNGRFRDTVRRFWRGDDITVNEMAFRLTGSPDLYLFNGRGPWASVNFVTAHDGFTLRDLVSYNDKHNSANGEGNRDGENHNNSWNCGAEGPTDDPAINRLRARQQRNFLATLFLAQGVPMLLAGDECGRTQLGNNNAYCQDNELTWLHWDLDDAAQELLTFTRKLTALRAAHPALCPRIFAQRPLPQRNDPDGLVWYRPDGEELTEEEWLAGPATCVAMLLDGTKTDNSDILLLLLNAHHQEIGFTLPGTPGTVWAPLLDTDGTPRVASYPSGGDYPLQAHSLALLRGEGALVDHRRSMAAVASSLAQGGGPS